MLNINEHIEIGKINRLKVLRVTQPGLYLEALDQEVVLLPNIYITSSMQVDSVVEVFIYTDSEDRIVATTLTPKAMLDQFAVLQVVDVAPFGAFLDIGLPKDLFVPKNKQKSPFKIGEKRLVKVVEDTQTNRLIGIQKFSQYLSKNTNELKPNQKVEILVYAKTPLGYKVIIDSLYEGMIFKNEIFEDIKIGDKKTAYIKQIRLDKKVDISLQPIGKADNQDFYIAKILDTIKANGNQINITTKSDPQEIQDKFGLSKKIFKSTVNSLIKEGKLELKDNQLILSNSFLR